MQQIDTATQTSSKTEKLSSIRIDLTEVQRLYKRLQKISLENGQIFVSKLQNVDNQTDQLFEKTKQDISDLLSAVTVVITGKNGNTLIGHDENVFESENLPDPIQTILITNAFMFRTRTNQNPHNFFDLTLDFSRPPLIDIDNSISSPTPNNSAINVVGNSDSWIGSVTNAVSSAFANKKTLRSWLHKGFVYDLGLLVIGFPYALYLCWRIWIKLQELNLGLNPVIEGGIYAYVFLLCITVYRALFGYSKWAFPSVELKGHDEISKRHQVFWSAIMLSLIGEILAKFLL